MVSALDEDDDGLLFCWKCGLDRPGSFKKVGNEESHFICHGCLSTSFQCEKCDGLTWEPIEDVIDKGDRLQPPDIRLLCQDCAMDIDRLYEDF